jgi:hypothetical protein
VFDTSVVSALFHINILEKLVEFKHSFEHTELILPKEVFDELKLASLIFASLKKRYLYVKYSKGPFFRRSSSFGRHK